MKAFISGVITLLILISAVTLNAIFLSRTTDDILATIDAFPQSPDDADFLPLVNKWKKCSPIIALTVDRSVIDEIDQIICVFITEASAGNEHGYLLSRARLKNVFSRLRDTESFSLYRIF